HWGRKDSVLNSIEIKTDFNIGRKLNYYAEKTPTEETPIIFVRNWTENRGEEDPSDVMNIYLPEDKVCTPVVSDGNVTSGTVLDAPEPEPEYVDGLRVYELSGSYSLPNLEVPNTTAQDTADKYYWNDGYYRLVGDTTFTAELINSSNALSSVYINENVIIDLNGYTLTVDPIRFQTTADCNFTILDSGENGQLNGPAFMWGAGNFNLFGGTLNLTDNNRDYGQDWVFNLLGGNLYLDGAVVNCYHDSDSIMIQAMNSIIEIKSGEINCLPNVIHTFHQYLLFAMNSTVDVTGGTLRLESDGQGYLMDVYDSTVEISGGSFVATSKDTKETRVADTRVISGSLSNRSSIEITGGRFETNGDGCIEVPCGKKDTLTLGGNIEMVSANYDVYYGNTTVNPLNISSDFNLGRIMKVYTKKTIPSENNTMIFVKDWTKNKGEINPKDVFVICLPDGTTREPYVLEGKAVCGGVYENETVLNDTGEHIWNGSYDLATGEVASGMAISDSSLDVSVDRGTYKLESDVTLLDSSRDMGIISVTKTVEIDLQGHTLQGENIQLMVQEATGKLTIKDSVGGGKVTGHIEINASDSSELHIIGGSYDLNDPSGKRNCLYITGAAFSAKDATFTLYDNNNPRAGIYIGAGSSTLENCVVNYTGDDKSYAYTNSAVRVKGNATLTNCRITAKNDYGEVVALQKEGGIVKLVNCKLEASSNKIVPTFKYRACALENSAQYSSGRVEIDGGEYISNGPCAIFSKDQMIIHRAPQYVCSGNADIVLNSVENGYGAMEITAAYTPNTKTRVEFKSKDFSKLASASRSFVKNWNLYMSGKSPASVFKFMDSGFRLYVDGRDLYIGLKEVAPVATPTPAPSNTATIEQPVTVVVEPEDSSDERKEENTQEDIIQEEEEDLEEEEVIAPEVYTNISVNSADSKGVSKQKVTTSYDGTATVTKLTSSKKRVSLGATVEVDGVVYTVTSIGKNAFKNCKKVQTVTLPETITTIEKGAFAGAKKLRTIKLDIEKSITVEKNAFKGVNTSNMIIKVSKSMSKKELKKFKKELKKAGFEGSVERKL
nr:leucine-rich repeat domain-containing protein [Lachnospiraceae bacterium]